ncbi:MAG TPA: LCP family protein [Clostridia bacterium]|nr:LCP family protein [Clostridia bacterium]
MKKPLKILLIVLALIVVIGLIVVGAGYLYLRKNIDKIQKLEVENVEITQGVTSGKRYQHVALLGIDTRQDVYTGCRSDCIIIATIDNQEKKVKLTSVYRDTYLEIPGKGLDKVTHAYAFGQASLALSTLNRNLDLDITEVVVVNFSAAKDIVDKIGGIEMTIDADEVKFIKGIDKPGTYTLTGEQALAYSRIRYTDGGDYKRTERMRDVVIKVYEKAKTKNMGEVKDLIEKLLPEISTNVTTDEILSSLFKLYSYNITESTGWPYETSGKMINGVFYGVPVDLEANVTKLHKEIFGEENYTPSETVKQISNKLKKIK